jgi:hypothetical protein
MSRITRRRPSPLMLVAGAALVAALAGTAIADPLAITSVLNKKEKKQVKNISKNQANLQINQRAPGLSVAHASSAESAASATNAANASNATNAAHADQADNANTANGVTVRSIRYHAPEGNSPVQVLSMGGLTLTANCITPNQDASLQAATTADNATLNSMSFTTITGAFENLVPRTDFDVADGPVELVANGDNLLVTIQYSRPLSLSQPPSAVTVQVQADSSEARQDCVISGHAFSQG